MLTTRTKEAFAVALTVLWTTLTALAFGAILMASLAACAADPIQGPPGPSGMTGPAGVAGMQGAPGPQGVEGPSALYSNSADEVIGFLVPSPNGGTLFVAHRPGNTDPTFPEGYAMSLWQVTADTWYYDGLNCTGNLYFPSSFPRDPSLKTLLVLDATDRRSLYSVARTPAAATTLSAWDAGRASCSNQTDTFYKYAVTPTSYVIDLDQPWTIKVH